MKSKYLILQISALIFISSNFTFGQTKSPEEKFRELQPDIYLGILDKENSDQSIAIDTLTYDEIPKYLDFRGTMVSALKWSDSAGENILVQTVTGYFDWKDYLKDSSDYMIQTKSELYAYLFQKPNAEKEFRRKWRVYDYTECFGVDWYTGFIHKATTITDVDNDGITEVSMPYVSICRGGMDPGILKIIMYEGSTKYAMRGSTMLMCKGEHPYGGEFTPSENLEQNKVFMDFLKKHWDRNKCEEGRFY